MEYLTVKEARQLAKIQPKGWRLVPDGESWFLALATRGEKYILATAARGKARPSVPREFKSFDTALRVAFEDIGLKEVLVWKK